MAASALVNEKAVVANLADQLWNDVDPTLNSGGEPYMNEPDAGYLPYLLFTAGNPYSYNQHVGEPDSVRPSTPTTTSCRRRKGRSSTP